jgi:hypothetical protein
VELSGALSRALLHGGSKGRPVALEVLDDGPDRHRCVASLHEVVGHVERGVALVARREDISDDVGHGETGEVGDLTVEQSRFPLAPLPGQVVVTHRVFDRTRHVRLLVSAQSRMT